MIDFFFSVYHCGLAFVLHDASVLLGAIGASRSLYAAGISQLVE
jgi:hypothetical protein